MQKIGITIGDPKGIGTEIIAKAWKALSPSERESVIIYGDHAILTYAEELVRAEITPRHIVTTSSTKARLGEIEDSEAARIALLAIDAAISDIKSKRIAGIVTAPVNKIRMQGLSPNFLGHTEYFAKKAGVKKPVMMFASSEGESALKLGIVSPPCFSLVTMHMSLKDVPSSVTTTGVLNTILKTATALEDFFSKPGARIAVMSLNPHGGEGGALGTEEKSVIAPAIARAVKKGINCHGPFGADSLFQNLKNFDYDAVVAMYHDQALIPAKLLYQSNAVNVTLGLPYIRTSPGHGTAEDIAWLGKADETGMLAAVRLAQTLVGRNS